MNRILLTLLAVFCSAAALAQTNPAAKIARDWRQQNERAIVDEFVDFLSIPNVETRENS